MGDQRHSLSAAPLRSAAFAMASDRPPESQLEQGRREVGQSSGNYALAQSDNCLVTNRAGIDRERQSRRVS